MRVRVSRGLRAASSQTFPSIQRFKAFCNLHQVALPITAGWEAVMRVRCSRGLRIASFHGPMFVRSTDLLALPQVRCLM